MTKKLKGNLHQSPIRQIERRVRRQIILEENEVGVHLMSAVNSEYAICGDAFDGYCNPDGRKQEVGVMQKTTKEKVTCKKCLKQIKNVKDYLFA
jgi:hypothetical protein